MIGNNVYGGGSGSEKKTTASLGYVSNDIFCHLDGEYNMGGYPHDSTAISHWVGINDVVGTRAVLGSGVLGNNYYETDGTRSTLIKVEDSGFFSSLTSQITYEIIFQWNNIDGSGEIDVCSNYADSGFGFYRQNGYNSSEINIYGSYRTITSTNPIILNKKYCLQCSYNGERVVFFENGIKVGEVETSGEISQGTSFGIGGAGNANYLSQIRCYAFRVYSRGLSEVELAQNYAIDASRFGIT